MLRCCPKLDKEGKCAAPCWLSFANFPTWLPVFSMWKVTVLLQHIVLVWIVISSPFIFASFGWFPSRNVYILPSFSDPPSPPSRPDCAIEDLEDEDIYCSWTKSIEPMIPTVYTLHWKDYDGCVFSYLHHHCVMYGHCGHIVSIWQYFFCVCVYIKEC